VHSYDHLLELATLCAHHARTTSDVRTAGEFWRMAYEYLDRAIHLDRIRRPADKPTDSGNLAETLSVEREQRTRELAYSIWEREGRPEAQAVRHWLMAEMAINSMIAHISTSGQAVFH
jgi:hypothetical protein